MNGLILGGVDEMRQHMTKVGVEIAGQNHFYLRTAVVDRKDGGKTDVETLMAEFLYARLGLADLTKAEA